MEIWKKNRMILQKYHPKLYKEYIASCQNRDAVQRQDDVAYHVEISTGKDALPVVTVQHKNQAIRLNSPYYPGKEAERWVQQFSLEKVTAPIIMFGLGAGIFVSSILHHRREQSPLFIYEPEETVFTQIVSQVDLEKILCEKQVFLAVGDLGKADWEKRLLSYLHWTTLGEMVCTFHSGYPKVFPEAYEKFVVYFEQKKQKLQGQRDTQVHFSKVSVKNSLHNKKYISSAVSISDLVGKIPNQIPTIVIAAGPSLDDNIEVLKELKGHAFLLAVDTAITPLMQYEIVPDAFVTLDPEKPFSLIQYPAIQKIPLFCCMEANPEIMQYHHGLKIWFKDGLLLHEIATQFNKTFPPYDAGGSVATAAFEIAALLGSDTLVLVGQDLAYKGTANHAGGVDDSVLREEETKRMVPGIMGEPVVTRGDWYLYLQWFQTRIASLASSKYVVDATEGGAYIEGTHIGALQDIAKQCSENKFVAQTLWERVNPMFHRDQRQVEQCLQELIGQLKLLQASAKEGMLLCETVQKNWEVPEKVKQRAIWQEQLSRCNGKVQQNPMYPLADMYISETTAAYVDQSAAGTEKENSLYQQWQWAGKIYEALEEATQEMQTFLS